MWPFSKKKAEKPVELVSELDTKMMEILKEATATNVVWAKTYTDDFFFKGFLFCRSYKTGVYALLDKEPFSKYQFANGEKEFERIKREKRDLEVLWSNYWVCHRLGIKHDEPPAIKILGTNNPVPPNQMETI